MSSRILLALLAAPAMLAAPMLAQAADYTEVEDDTLVVQPYKLTIEQIGDMGVFNAEGTQIGEVEDVLSDASGKIVAFSVETEDYLGTTGDDAVVSLDQLQLNGDHFVTELTGETITALPRWKD